MTYRQEALLRQALAERGVQADTGCTREDHWHGRARAGDRVVGLVYPDSFFDEARKLFDTPRSIHLYFVGSVNRGNGRRPLLEPFWHHPDAVIIESTRGRTDAKNRWDPEYYEALATAEFGLCPHHLNWPGPWTHLWTYRFVDCCLVGTIPVLFRPTPLAPWFVEGFRYAWDDAGSFTYSREDAEHNRTLAEERFRL